MKSIFKTFALTAGLALASTGSQAALINISFSSDPNAETNFINSLVGSYVTETFDSLDAGAGIITSGAGLDDQERWENSSSKLLVR